MAGRLSSAASRLLGGGGVCRSVRFSIPNRSGMGLPVGKHIVPDKPLPEEDELVWDNGTPFPEPCVDRLVPNMSKYESLAWLCGGLGFFATLGLLAVWNDKASKIPFTLRQSGQNKSKIKYWLISRVSAEPSLGRSRDASAEEMRGRNPSSSIETRLASYGRVDAGLRFCGFSGDRMASALVTDDPTEGVEGFRLHLQRAAASCAE